MTQGRDNARRVTIDADGWHISIAPELGGAIEHVLYRGKPILRAPDRAITTAREAGCFPMLPYANRVAGGRFEQDGRRWQLPTEPNQPYSLHGIGWKGRWTVAAHDDRRIELSYRHGGDGTWPWPFAARQTVTIDDRDCDITLGAVNLDGCARPLGLGLHAFFPMDAATRLRAHASHLWRTDQAALPMERVPITDAAGWVAGAPLVGLGSINTSFEGWDGRAFIGQRDMTLSLFSDDCTRFQLYRPADAAFFAFEPVDHSPDALNRGAMPRVAALSGTSLRLKISVRPRARHPGETP